MFSINYRRATFAAIPAIVLILASTGCKEPSYQGIGLGMWMKQLAASDPDLRLSALDGIEKIGMAAKSQTPALVSVAQNDPLPRVRVAAIKVLDELGTSNEQLDKYLQRMTASDFGVTHEDGGPGVIPDIDADRGTIADQLTTDDDLDYLKVLEESGSPEESGTMDLSQNDSLKLLIQSLVSAIGAAKQNGNPGLPLNLPGQSGMASNLSGVVNAPILLRPNTSQTGDSPANAPDGINATISQADLEKAVQQALAGLSLNGDALQGALIGKLGGNPGDISNSNLEQALLSQLGGNLGSGSLSDLENALQKALGTGSGISTGSARPAPHTGLPVGVSDNLSSVPGIGTPGRR